MNSVVFCDACANFACNVLRSAGELTNCIGKNCRGTTLNHPPRRFSIETENKNWKSLSRPDALHCINFNCFVFHSFQLKSGSSTRSFTASWRLWLPSACWSSCERSIRASPSGSSTSRSSAPTQVIEFDLQKYLPYSFTVDTFVIG